MAEIEKRSACHNSSVHDEDGKTVCDVCAKECEVVDATSPEPATAPEGEQTAPAPEATGGEQAAPQGGDAPAGGEGGQASPEQAPEGGNTPAQG